MKHKFNKKQKTYHLKRGEYLYIPTNLSSYLDKYEITSPKSKGFIYIKMNEMPIAKFSCGLTITIKKGFEIACDLFTDITEDEVRFDID
jgi:hypothetical protein